MFKWRDMGGLHSIDMPNPMKIPDECFLEPSSNGLSLLSRKHTIAPNSPKGEKGLQICDSPDSSIVGG